MQVPVTVFHSEITDMLRVLSQSRPARLLNRRALRLAPFLVDRQ